MIQDLIYERFGVFYSVNYISQLLKNMGFSYQKAKFVSDHLDEEARKKMPAEHLAQNYEARRRKGLSCFVRRRSVLSPIGIAVLHMGS
jgi:hypothetical protein